MCALLMQIGENYAREKDGNVRQSFAAGQGNPHWNICWTAFDKSTYSGLLCLAKMSPDLSGDIFLTDLFSKKMEENWTENFFKGFVNFCLSLKAINLPKHH